MGWGSFSTITPIPKKMTSSDRAPVSRLHPFLCLISIHCGSHSVREAEVQSDHGPLAPTTIWRRVLLMRCCHCGYEWFGDPYAV